MCMGYISAFLNQAPAYRNAVALLQSFPMLSYVLSSGFSHLAHVDPGSAAVLEALQSLGLDVRHHPSHWGRLCELREGALAWPYPPWPSSRHDFIPYILIAYSSPGLLKSFLSGGLPLKPRFGTNPLVYAADFRQIRHAMVLLASGADVNSRGLVVDESHYALPLEVAVDLGDDTVVGELLERGCAVPWELLATAVCMPWCSTRVLLKLMQTNEFLEWAHEIGDEKLYRSIFNSARPNAGDSRKTDEDHVAVARILRQIGQDLSADSRFGTELVERSIRAAHTSMLEFLLPQDQPPPARFLFAAATGDTPETVPVVRFLLHKGADVHAVSDGCMDTALHLAVLCPWEPRRLELVEILIEAGCNATISNAQGKTALDIAIERGYKSAAELLRSYKVQFSPSILPTALEKCATLEMVEYLIRNGADVHATTSGGDTVLHLAIRWYGELESLSLVKRFIEAACNPIACNSMGQTIIGTAIGCGYTSVVELLRSCKVKFPPDALPFALQKCAALEMVEYLIRNGADVHSTTSGGDTVLHLAIREYSESTCLSLVRRFIEAGCDPIAYNSKGKTVLDTAIERGRASAVELLRSCKVEFPPDVLLIALQECSAPKMVECLIRNGADVYSITSGGDTVLHLAITEYDEQACLFLVKRLIEAGCNPITQNLKRQKVLETAIVRGYNSVAEYLLSHEDFLPPSEISTIALQECSPPQIPDVPLSFPTEVYTPISLTIPQSLPLRPTTHGEHYLGPAATAFNHAFNEDVLLCPFPLGEHAKGHLFLGRLRASRPWLGVEGVSLWVGL